MSIISLEDVGRNRDERSWSIILIYIYIHIYICIYESPGLSNNTNPVEQFLINLKDIAFIKYVDMPVYFLVRNIKISMQFAHNFEIVFIMR
jgi:hypothetical protein